MAQDYYTSIRGVVLGGIIASMIAFTIFGRVPVYAFPLLLALGILAGFAGIVMQGPRRIVWQQVTAAYWAIIGALIAARAGFVLAEWAYFSKHLLETPQVWLGGLSGAAGIGGGLIGLGLYGWTNRETLSLIDFGRMLDGLALLLTSVSVAAWLGCWIDGVLYGPLTTAWWGLLAPDEWSRLDTRWPVQPLGALLSLLAIVSVDYASRSYHRRRRGYFPPGFRFGLVLLIQSLILLAANWVRQDPIPLLSGIPAGAWLAGLYIFVSLTGLLILYDANARSRSN